MKVTTILGSPRTEGNTAHVIEWIEDELTAKGHEVDRVNISEVEIKGCRSCYSCRRNPKEPACVIEDDAESVFKRMIAADAILFSTPLYCWTYSSQLKALIDRCFSLVSGYQTEQWISLIEGKKTGLLVTCIGPIEGNADLIGPAFSRFTNWAKLDNAGEFIVPFCAYPDKIPSEYQEKARDFAAKLSG